MDFQGVCNALAMRTHCSVQVNRRESNSTDSFQFSSLSEIGIRCNRSRDSIDPSPPFFAFDRIETRYRRRFSFLPSLPFLFFFLLLFPPIVRLKKMEGRKQDATTTSFPATAAAVVAFARYIKNSRGAQKTIYFEGRKLYYRAERGWQNDDFL